jgi:small subunit ribosomal protein S24e
MAGSGPGQMYLVGCTRLDPMTYVLFGAYNLTASSEGLKCDDWLPLVGHFDALDDIRSLKVIMESCMLRVFEGINSMEVSQRRSGSAPSTAGKYVPPFRRQNRDNEENESGEEDDGEQKRNKGQLTKDEIKELDVFTHEIVRILDRYADERRLTQSRRNSRPATPVVTPMMAARALPALDGSWRSGASTPLRYESRPASRLGVRP